MAFTGHAFFSFAGAALPGTVAILTTSLKTPFSFFLLHVSTSSGKVTSNTTLAIPSFEKLPPVVVRTAHVYTHTLSLSRSIPCIATRALFVPPLLPPGLDPDKHMFHALSHLQATFDKSSGVGMRRDEEEEREERERECFITFLPIRIVLFGYQRQQCLHN